VTACRPKERKSCIHANKMAMSKRAHPNGAGWNKRQKTRHTQNKKRDVASSTLLLLAGNAVGTRGRKKGVPVARESGLTGATDGRGGGGVCAGKGL